MEKKFYEIGGKEYTLRDICNEYGVSRSTFLRKVEKGLPIEECVKKNTTYKDYKAETKKREVNWPAELVVDILENCGVDILENKAKFNIDEIIEHFDSRLEALYDENKKSFRDVEKDMVELYYKEGLTVVEISKKYEMSKQRVSTIINTYLKKFQKRVFLKYIVEDVKNLGYFKF